MAETEGTKKKKEVKFRHGLLAFALLAAAMFLCVVVLGTEPQMPMVIGCACAGIIALYLGYEWEDVLDAMSKGILDAMEAVLILMCIGMLVGTWIMSGTVPTLIYYGLSVISPQLFLPVAFLGTLLVGIVLGSWGAAGTIGIAFIGIAAALDIPLGMAAGAIISDAYVSEIASPLTDGPVLCAAVGSGAVFNVLMPDQYPAIAMSCKMYGDSFARRGTPGDVWSNIVNSAAGITSVLVPWNTCSIYMVTIMGVACLQYLPYAFFCYLYPITVALLALFFGRRLGWVPADAVQPAPDAAAPADGGVQPAVSQA